MRPPSSDHTDVRCTIFRSPTWHAGGRDRGAGRSSRGSAGKRWPLSMAVRELSSCVKPALAIAGPLECCWRAGAWPRVAGSVVNEADSFALEAALRCGESGRATGDLHHRPDRGPPLRCCLVRRDGCRPPVHILSARTRSWTVPIGCPAGCRHPALG